MIYSLFSIFLFIAMNSYCQEKIEWESKIKRENVISVDTLQMMVGKYAIMYRDGIGYHTESLRINGNCFYLIFLPVGSGIARWHIIIYKTENDLWRLVAEGEVYRYSYSIQADFDSSNNNIVFSEIHAEIDSSNHKIKSLTRGEVIGILSLSDL